MKVTVYPVHMCAQTGLLFFLSLDIIILTARRKEANNYVTQKTISPPRLGHFLVLPLLPLSPLLSFCPLRHVKVSLMGWKTAPPQTVLLFISCDSCERQKNALITIPAVQGYSKVLVPSASPGRRRMEGGGKTGERDGKRWGRKERERERKIREMWGGRL